MIPGQWWSGLPSQLMMLVSQCGPYCGKGSIYHFYTRQIHILERSILSVIGCGWLVGGWWLVVEPILVNS